MSIWIFCIECGKNFESRDDTHTCSNYCLRRYEHRQITAWAEEEKPGEPQQPPSDTQREGSKGQE